jgi:hypothetical protein
MPLPGSQNCPSGHTTPAHGTGKQPATQRPSMQLWPRSQRTLAQGSRRGTQKARQLSAPQTFSAVLHGSGVQRPPMLRWPGGQKRSSGQRRPSGAPVSASAEPSRVAPSPPSGLVPASGVDTPSPPSSDASMPPPSSGGGEPSGSVPGGSSAHATKSAASTKTLSDFQFMYGEPPVTGALRRPRAEFD